MHMKRSLPKKLIIHRTSIVVLQVEEGEEMHGLQCFTLNTDKKSYMVAAMSQVERSKWMEVKLSV